MCLRRPCLPSQIVNPPFLSSTVPSRNVVPEMPPEALWISIFKHTSDFLSAPRAWDNPSDLEVTPEPIPRRVTGKITGIVEKDCLCQGGPSLIRAGADSSWHEEGPCKGPLRWGLPYWPSLYDIGNVINRLIATPNYPEHK